MRHRPPRTVSQDALHQDLTNLVDALVEAVDTDREEAVDRVQTALQPFGGSGLFAAELRLNGRSSEQLWAALAEWVVF